MNREEFLYLIPYLFSLSISLGVFIYTWRHRYVRGARVYSWFVWGQIITIIGFLLELTASDIQTKILWDKFQWLTDSYLIILPFLIFSLQYSEHELRRPRITWTYWIGIPVIFTLILLTDNVHHLIYPNPHLSTDYPFPDLQYDFTFVVYIYLLLYLYGANLFGISLLVRRATQSYNAYRLQYWTIIIGFLLPLFLTFFSLFGIKITQQRDISPFSLAVGNLVVAWGLFRYGLFDIVPIAREHIVENVTDPIVVLDANNRVVDINPAALKSLGKENSKIIGSTFRDLFASWPDIVQVLENRDVDRREIAIMDGEDRFFYELTVSPVHNKRGQLLGRVIVARDVTRHKTLEAGYRTLSEELEQRVAERTEDLQQTAERFRALFEQTNDAVFILDLQGNHLDVNQRAADLLGYTREELLGLSAGDVSAEMTESELVLKRLLSGEQIPLYERLFRKKDGTLLPVEINLDLVRDLNGNPLHIQSAVRDISERKRSEQALRNSAERYRAVVEHQTEFIVRWKPDGTRTFVNDAYCRYFGITPEQALYTSFVPLVAEEDRQAVEGKISRLVSGAVRVEKEIHRVIKPDGSIGWQEWTDQAICDENGNLVEFQSVGRDVTERKQAEDMILKQFTFDTLMTRLLTDFATCSYEQVDASIENALKEIADFFDSDFANIFIVSEDKRTWNSTHHWISPELENIIQPAINIPVGTLKWSEGRLLKGESIRINSLDDYPPEAARDRQFGAEDDVQSLLTVPIRGREGSVFGTIDIVAYTHPIKWSDTDITHLRIMGDAIANTLERKRTETALQKSEMKHRLLFESANDSIFLMKDDRFVDCNTRTLEMFGCNREEIIGKSPVDYSPDIQPDGRKSTEKAMEKITAVLDGIPQFFEWKHCRLDQTLFDAEVSLSLLQLENETFIQAIVRDITERKQAEEALRQSEERFSKAFRASPIIITISQISDAKLLEVNETFEKITGYKREEAIGKATFDLGFWVDREDRKRLLSEVLANGEVRGQEIQFRIKNGNVLTCLVSADLIELSGEKCILATIEDITERKKAEERLAEAYDTTLEGWANALELRDKETEGHSRRVTETTIRVARALGFTEEQLVHVRRGSILHDIGKMGIPDEILRKRGPLTDGERSVIVKHPTTAYNLLKPISYLEKALDIPYCHHEKWDGTGYPRGLKGEEIPLSARIFAVVDVWDALRADRPYRDAWSPEKVAQYIIDESGKHFDPSVVSVFLQMMDKGGI